MDALLFQAIGFGGLILYGMIMCAVVLNDLRHKSVAPPAPIVVTGMTAQGVPWVAGT